MTVAQWGVLRKLHLNLSHPTASALKRRLRLYEVPQRILDAVDKLECRICAEVKRPATIRSAAWIQSQEFNENVFLDEIEVVLSDMTRVVIMVILDDASSFRVFVPTKATRTITGVEARNCF